jgi:uncharacterized integral membrane protein
LATLRRILFATLSIALILLAAMFAYSNPIPIDVDIGFMKLERVSLALAFAFVFVAGWLFGLITVALTLVRHTTEKRRLKKSLRHAEAELTTLRAPQSEDAN